MAYKEIKVYWCKCENPNCRHEWTTRTNQLPAACPRCHSRSWNIPDRNAKQPRLGVNL